MKKPLIGVVPLWDEERDSLWMLPGYFDGLRQAGALPVMLPLTRDPAELRQLAGTVDGLLFTGGHDVSPTVYGEAPLPLCGACCPERDEMERLLLDAALELDRPVLGICRGIQVINALLGGTLYQDLPAQHPSPVQHHQSPPYDVPCHPVTVGTDTPLFPVVGAASIDVNSYHHQGVKDLSPRLRPMAWAPDGLVEAVWMPGRAFVWAVQWHPEFSYKTSPASQGIFRAFVSAAAGNEGMSSE